MKQPRTLTVETRSEGVLAACFSAMASPCEVLIDTDDEQLAFEAGLRAASEALRIEKKFSRYRPDSVVSAINASQGQAVAVDDETAQLIDFAFHCHQLSDGLFDITSGVLRKVWRFDGSDRVPEAGQVAALLPSIGLDKVLWRKPEIILPAGMELDFGGIGKEYAVDRVLGMLVAEFQCPMLVNFGGDLCASEKPSQGAWQIGVERPGTIEQAALVLELTRGGLATSGDTRRHLLKAGRRYGHILNPKTGWPIEGGPRSVTVAASTCMEAGMLATFSLLQGPAAKDFLCAQSVTHWCLD
jgi:thiamine biosynthesis lipoprotein